MIPSSSSGSSTPTNRTLDGSTETITNSAVRPRNRRLNTLEDQELSTTSRRSSPGGSRAVSPIPARHPSRANAGSGASTSSRANGEGNGERRTVGGLLAPAEISGGRGTNGNKNGSGRSSPVSAGGMWNTGWMSSALQQVASSVLGSMAPEDEPGKPRPRPRRRSAEKRVLHAEWGPEQLPGSKPKDAGIGMGSTDERDALVRARKMRGILEGRDEDRRAMDTNGKYKRRTSIEEERPSTPKDEGDALVYVHHVKPTDTFAGVVVKYNCQKEVFRKANGLWSNDGLQFRKTVLLPVDACAIKGRPCDPPSDDPAHKGVDLLAPTPGIEEPPFTNGDTWPSISPSYGKSAEPPEDDGKPRTHVRWVLIDASPSSQPVEIARMSRKTLGYFPPRRRKSIATQSTVSTPRGSIDLTRNLSKSISSDIPIAGSISSTSSTPSRRTSNLGPRPSQPFSTIGSYFPPSPMTRPTRPRRESVGEAVDRLGWMRGPGGVGTMSSNVRKPGPAQDGLNAWAKKHIPGLGIGSLPSASIMGAETAHFGFSDELAAIAEGPYNSSVTGTATPSGSGMGLENAAAAVEGFFRKLVVKGPGTPLQRARAESDLIELLDGAGSDDGRGFELSPGHVRSATPVGTGREDLDSVIRGQASAGMKGGKSD